VFMAIIKGVKIIIGYLKNKNLKSAKSLEND
jgi:hypothetical protein